MPDINEINSSELPFSLDAEQMVLGSVIVDPELLDKVLDKLTPDHFHYKTHRGIYSVMQKMFIGSSDPINLLTLSENCVRNKVFDSSEQAKEYLFKLSRSAVETSSLDSYVKIIRDKCLLRQLMTASREIYDKAGSGVEEPNAVLDYAEKRIYDIRSEKEVSGLVHIAPTVHDELIKLAYFAEHPDEANQNGLSSGFPSLDSVIHGLNPSDLIVIAARPGMGKTSFAMNIATNAARIRPDKKVAIFSLEMSREQIVERMLSSEGRVPLKQLKDGILDRSMWRGLNEAAEMLSKVGVYVDETASITVGEMKTKLRRMEDLGLVVIDYLQLMTTNRHDVNRVAEVSELTRNLKILAKDLNVPVILLSQLSRNSEKRKEENQRPKLSDLRDSGSIEQDADIVIFLVREVYGTEDEGDKNECECVVEKNRHGEQKVLHLRWDGEITRFSDLERRYEEPAH